MYKCFNYCIIIIIIPLYSMWVWHFQEVILQKQHPFIYTFLCHRWCWMHCSANEAMSGHCCSAVGGDRGPGAGSRYLPAQRKGGRHQCYYESLEFTCGLGAFNASRRVRGGEWKGSILYQHKKISEPTLLIVTEKKLAAWCHLFQPFSTFPPGCKEQEGILPL